MSSLETEQGRGVVVDTIKAYPDKPMATTLSQDEGASADDTLLSKRPPKISRIRAAPEATAQAMDPLQRILDAVPFTPSQGVKSPSPRHAESNAHFAPAQTYQYRPSMDRGYMRASFTAAGGPPHREAFSSSPVRHRHLYHTQRGSFRAAHPSVVGVPRMHAVHGSSLVFPGSPHGMPSSPDFSSTFSQPYSPSMSSSPSPPTSPVAFTHDVMHMPGMLQPMHVPSSYAPGQPIAMGPSLIHQQAYSDMVPMVPHLPPPVPWVSEDYMYNLHRAPGQPLPSMMAHLHLGPSPLALNPSMQGLRKPHSPTRHPSMTRPPSFKSSDALSAVLQKPEAVAPTRPASTPPQAAGGSASPADISGRPHRALSPDSKSPPASRPIAAETLQGKAASPAELGVAESDASSMSSPGWDSPVNAVKSKMEMKLVNGAIVFNARQRRTLRRALQRQRQEDLGSPNFSVEDALSKAERELITRVVQQHLGRPMPEKTDLQALMKHLLSLGVPEAGSA